MFLHIQLRHLYTLSYHLYFVVVLSYLIIALVLYFIILDSLVLNKNTLKNVFFFYKSSQLILIGYFCLVFF